MKSRLSVIAVLAAILVTGCSTFPKQSPAQAAATAIRALVPAAVQYAAAQDTNTVPYLKASALALDIAVANGQYTPDQIKAALNAVNAKELHTPLAQAAVLAGVGLYEGFFQTTVVSNEDAVLVITSIASSIRAGLPPNDPAKLSRAMRRHS